MPKSLDANIIAQLDAQQKRPVFLLEVGLSSTLRFAAYKTNITFPTGGNVYTAKAIQVSNPKTSIEGQLDRITVKFDNVAKDMAAYANIEDFRGKSLIIKRIYLDEISDEDYYVEIFNGFLERPTEISRQWLTVPATIGSPLNRKALRVSYQRMCPWLFGGSECNTNGNADLTALTATGTADSGTVSTLVDNALTQIDDYWNNGRISIAKSGKTYHRIVSNFDAASDTITLDVNLPFAIDNTCTYEVFKGCDQTWDTCEGTAAYGPSADNQLNFGGCIHVSKLKDFSSGSVSVATAGGGSDGMIIPHA